MTVKDTVTDTAHSAKVYASDKLAAASDKLHDASAHLRETAGAARTNAADTLSVARDKVADAYDVARERSASAADAARDKANAAYANARETASTVKHKTADGIEESPLAALIGGVAIGVLLGALLPRSQREAETLGPLGEKLGTLAKNAFVAAKEAGQDTLDELGVNKEGARQQVDRLIDTAGKAASSASTAAAETIRSPQSGGTAQS